MALNLAQKLARQPTFDPKNIGVGGPINIVLSCSACNSPQFIKNYEQINWTTKKENANETMPKM